MAVLVDIISQLCCIVFRQVPHADVGVYAGGSADVGRGLAADAVNIGKGNLDPLVTG